MGALIRLLAMLARPLAGAAKKHGPRVTGSLFRQYRQRKQKRQQQQSRQQQQNQPSAAQPNQPSVLQALVQASGAVFQQKASGARQQARSGLQRLGQAAYRLFVQNRPAQQPQRRRGSRKKPQGVFRSLASHARGLFQRQRRQQPKKPGVFSSILTRAAAARVQKPEPAKMPGLSPAQKLGMMGQSAQHVAAANKAEQEHQASQERNNRLLKEESELRDKLHDGLKKLLIGPLKAVAIVAGTILGIQKLANLTLAARAPYQFYSGQMAGAFTQLKMNDLRRDIQFANRTDSSTKDLAEAVNEFRQELQPIRENIATVTNAFVTGLVKIGTVIVKGVNLLENLPGIKEVLDLIEKENKEREQKEALPTAEFVDKLKHREFWMNGHRDRLPPL